MTDGQVFIGFTAQGTPFWRHTSCPYDRARVKHYEDGSIGEVWDEALTPDGPWVECAFVTLPELDSVFPLPPETPE